MNSPGLENADIITRTFFDGDRWSAHDFVGQLMAQGARWVLIAHDSPLEWTVSWPNHSAKDLSQELNAE